MKTKKLIRNIVIAAVVVVLIVAAILLTLALRRDGHGLNWFERNRKAASADGVSVSMIEYALTFDMMNSSGAAGTDEQIREMQENAAKQALLLKIYAKEAKAAGLSLTDEEVQQCRDTADKEIKGIEENYAKSLAQQGNYTKAALDKQLASYYRQIGLNQSQYYNFIRERAEANYYATKLIQYHDENAAPDDLDENEVLDYYRESVAETMDAYNSAEPDQRKDFFSTYMIYYNMGYTSPLLFVPEDFIYVDYIKLEKESTDEITAVIEQIQNGEQTFDALLDSEDNKDPYMNTLILPYPIGENDHSYLFADDDAYKAAAELELGEVGSFVDTEPTTDAEGKEIYTGYLFRRAEGKMCMEGDSGVINIDYYPGIRDDVESGLRQKHWEDGILSDVKCEDAVYAYKGQVG